MFILLSGYPPFNGKTDKDILEKIRVGKFEFKGTYFTRVYKTNPPLAAVWEKISQDAKNLISDMLTFKPEDRPDAEEILNYDWFHSASSYKIISDDGVLRRLSEFQVSCLEAFFRDFTRSNF